MDATHNYYVKHSTTLGHKHDKWRIMHGNTKDLRNNEMEVSPICRPNLSQTTLI